MVKIEYVRSIDCHPNVRKVNRLRRPRRLKRTSVLPQGKNRRPVLGRSEDHWSIPSATGAAPPSFRCGTDPHVDMGYAVSCLDPGGKLMRMTSTGQCGYIILFLGLFWFLDVSWSSGANHP